MRIRFSLRWVMIATMLFCVVFGFEARQARQQDRLATRLNEINGTFERRQRAYIPGFVSSWLPDSYATRIHKVAFGGMAAPTERRPTEFSFSFVGMKVTNSIPFDFDVVSTRRLREIVELPAMKSVESIALYGTSVDDDLAKVVRGLPAREIGFNYTSVNLSAAEEQAQPSTKERRINGPAAIGHFHPGAVGYTDDLQLFARAYEGDVQAMTKLLKNPKAVGPHRYDVSFLFAEHDSPEIHGVLMSALKHDDANVRRRAFGILTRRYTRGMPDGEAETTVFVDAAIELATDPHEPLRYAALEWLQQTKQEKAFDTMLVGLRDESPMVRGAAACWLGTLNDRRAIEPLQKCLSDDDKNVRRNAESSLAKLQEAP